MKWYYGGINIESYYYDIKEKLVSYYDITASNYYVNKYENKNFKYIDVNTNKSNEEEVKSNDLIVCGDIEIKNMDVLRKDYKINSKNPIEVIKALYEIKGIEFINYIYGSFSFVIVDYIKKKMYLIRDQIGEKQMFWGIEDGKIFFASDLFLLDNFYIKNKLNSRYFESYCQNSAYTDFELTPYKNVFRVNSASYISIDIEKFEYISKKYWFLQFVKDKWNISNDEECINKFKELLINSIKYSTSKKNINALALSGGLDSTSIFTITKRYTNNIIKPYCGVFTELLNCDEKNYIEDTMKMYDEKAEYIQCDGGGVLANYPKTYFYTSEPHINILNKAFSEKLYYRINKDNINSLCDGFFADHILTGNIIFLLDNNVTRTEKYRILKETLGAMNFSFLKTIYSYMILPKINKSYIPEMDLSLLKVNKNELKKVKKYSNKDMILQIKAIGGNFFGDRELAPRYNIERLHPFIDRELIEFLYCIPGQLRANGRISKYILRKSMKNIVPKSIIQRNNKTQHVELTQKGLRDNWGLIFNKLKVGRITKIPCIDMKLENWVEELLKFRSGQIENDNMYIYMSLEVWLQQVEEKFGNVVFE